MSVGYDASISNKAKIVQKNMSQLNYTDASNQTNKVAELPGPGHY